MLPAILPRVTIVEKVRRGPATTVRILCGLAGIECRVTGPSACRRVYLREGEVSVAREPGQLGSVAICVPEKSEKDRAILALGILAYAVFDYAARESMRGRPEAACSLPVGRPRKARPLSGAERQRRWRESR